MNNPFTLPMWPMLAAALIVSYTVDLLLNTLWGLTAYGPWLVTLGASLLWIRRRS